MIKGDGGAVGLTESDAALARWVIADPEILRILQDFEVCVGRNSDDNKHHEQTSAFQKSYKTDVQKLLQVYVDIGNPFSETCTDDLLSLDTNTLADEVVCNSIRIAHEIGNCQVNKFIEERLEGAVSILAPLPRNKLPLFTFKAKKRDFKSLKAQDLKTNCSLFSRLFVACQSRNGDLTNFFRHESQPYPPSLSHRGTLRFGTKSDLLGCLCSLSDTVPDISQMNVDTYVLDGAVIVQMVRPGCSKTFEEYREKIYLPYVKSILRNVTRLDIVYDIYLPNSLMSATREKRGTGTKHG